MPPVHSTWVDPLPKTNLQTSSSSSSLALPNILSYETENDAENINYHCQRNNDLIHSGIIEALNVQEVNCDGLEWPGAWFWLLWTSPWLWILWTGVYLWLNHKRLKLTFIKTLLLHQIVGYIILHCTKQRAENCMVSPQLLCVGFLQPWSSSAGVRLLGVVNGTFHIQTRRMYYYMKTVSKQLNEAAIVMVVWLHTFLSSWFAIICGLYIALTYSFHSTVL